MKRRWTVDGLPCPTTSPNGHSGLANGSSASAGAASLELERGASLARRRLLVFFALVALVVFCLPVTQHELSYNYHKYLRGQTTSRVHHVADASRPCEIVVDYAAQTLEVNSPLLPSSSSSQPVNSSSTTTQAATCSLYTVRSTQTAQYAEWRKTRGLQLADKGTVLLKVTTSFKYLDYYDAGVMSAALYSDMHGIPLYVYAQTQKNKEHWQDVLRPRVEGLSALFAKPEVQTVLLSDLDTWFDTAAANEYHIDSLLDRLSPRASFVIQGERALCACIWAMRRTDYAMDFLKRHEAECADKNYCNYFPFEQTAWLRLILQGVNNTNGYSFKTGACADDGFEQVRMCFETLKQS